MAQPWTPAARQSRPATINDLKLDHFNAMMTDIGIWQHGLGQAPDIRHGYSIDDVARALIVALRYLEQDYEPSFFNTVASTCFRFLENAAVSDGEAAGRFHNFSDLNGKWLDSIGSDDSIGRTVWALGVTAGSKSKVAAVDIAEKLLRRALPICDTLEPIRSKAFSILGLTECGMPDAAPTVKRLADSLVDAFDHYSSDGWRWFDDHMTYCNARMPQALFAAYQMLPSERRYVSVASDALDFLLKSTQNEKGSYAPIGNAPMAAGRWFKRGDYRPPLFDQQPVDAGATVESCALAYEVTAEPRFRNAAYAAYGWYFGDNIHGLSVYDPSNGGVCDALTPTGLNCNMGAESVLSIHLAAQALARLE